ncbi:MAG: hypothetical protein IT538_09040 [Variibacter sp.]|nr:hypothetical protein [Variibacter sp.]
MSPNRGIAVIHTDGTVCIHSIHATVVGAIVNWAAAHGCVLPNVSDEAVWAFWLKEGEGSTLSCVAVEPVEGGRIRSLSSVPGDA